MLNLFEDSLSLSRLTQNRNRLWIAKGQTHPNIGGDYTTELTTAFKCNFSGVSEFETEQERRDLLKTNIMYQGRNTISYVIWQTEKL